MNNQKKTKKYPVNENNLKIYEELYNTNINFQQVYKEQRLKLYEQIIDIMQLYKVKNFIDVGTAYGYIIKLAKKLDIKGYGIELSIKNLKDIHSAMGINSNIFYGNLENIDFIQSLLMDKKLKNIDCLICLDTLRYISSLQRFKTLVSNIKPQIIIIKEVSNNIYIRNRKKMERIKTKIFLAPTAVLNLLQNNYDVNKIFVSKFIFHINRPSRLIMVLINNLFPSYTIILKRK